MTRAEASAGLDVCITLIISSHLSNKLLAGRRPSHRCLSATRRRLLLPSTVASNACPPTLSSARRSDTTGLRHVPHYWGTFAPFPRIWHFQLFPRNRPTENGFILVDFSLLQNGKILLAILGTTGGPFWLHFTRISLHLTRIRTDSVMRPRSSSRGRNSSASSSKLR